MLVAGECSVMAFQCRKCGLCCEGKGGIVLSPKDMLRLCQHLHMQEAEFMQHYGMVHNGKAHIRSTSAGVCVFFVHKQGCCVHAHKPDICRAWPFFRGNMVDPFSFSMAKDFCAGITQDMEHTTFVAAGRVYLTEQGLMAQDSRTEAHALLPMDGHVTPKNI